MEPIKFTVETKGPTLVKVEARQKINKKKKLEKTLEKYDHDTFREKSKKLASKVSKRGLPVLKKEDILKTTSSSDDDIVNGASPIKIFDNFGEGTYK